ncbi:RnfH family protein [Oceanospirillum sediminis]|uniref:UPF0125 protein H4O21_07725 n=1 Tax=Oceanospirillum sediminis TaxID=2760088 RepID=A0A839IPX3_9GAMM|nr:RnfH family protein [Oceanospirillum sediminis]MBB1486497.1 RnfH family protein [Oceanospirillum sediminis]
MQISVAYSSLSGDQNWINLEVAEDTCAQQAIEISGILHQFPEIDLSQQKIGIFGKQVKPDQSLNEFDRVEIYRAITADPKQVPRRKTPDAD